MGKRLPTTPRSKVKDALRKLFLRSRERAAVLKRDGYSCVDCGVKQSKAKAKGREQSIQVHHKELIQWEEVIDYILERVLVNPDKMVCLCPKCHEKRHKGVANDE